VGRWQSAGIDPTGYDARAAVCEWVVENVDLISVFIPPEFPRVLVSTSDYGAWYMRIAQVLASVVGALALVALILYVKYRKTKAMVFAQPIFMELILVGFFMVCTGAVMYSLPPDEDTCTAANWLLTLGYTVELVPVLVKTAAINRLIRSSKKQRRVNISRRSMLIKVAVVIAFVMAFLIVWTALDPSKAVTSRRENATYRWIVNSDSKCGSNNNGWLLVSFAWQACLLLTAAILAFQSRDVMKQFNESKR
jgi:hypothetical protein